MNRYNAEHYVDRTANMAISNADRDAKNNVGRHKRDTIPRLMYKVAEIVDIFIIGGRIEIKRKNIKRGMR